MATYTENLNLKLPAGNENVSRQDLNANFQAIDDQVAKNTNAEFSGTFTFGTRAEGQTVGTRSTVFGERCVAGYGSTAIGYEAKATGASSFASGNGSKASGDFSHAVNNGSATNDNSFAAGQNTEANGACCVAFGHQNVKQPYTEYADWVPGTHYYPYDIVHIYSSASDEHRTYICITENSDTTFDNSKWHLNARKFVEVVGNGFGYPIDSNRSNARALDWKGNQYLMGTLICGCDPDSTGGKRLVFNQDGTVTWEAVT